MTNPLLAGMRSATRGVVRLSMLGLPRGPHITRYAMYREFVKYRGALDPTGRTLAVSHSLPVCEVLGIDPGVIVEANYPECNLLELPHADESFDTVVSDQVLEHVEGDPQKAIDESFRVLKPGGIAVHTTCFINPMHDKPGDYWRFTPEALRLLCRDASEIITAGGWGNRMAWVVELMGLRFDGIPETRLHPLHQVALHNEADWPIVTWIIARK